MLVAFNFDGSSEKNELLMKLVMKQLNDFHYSPKDLNDDLSENIYDEYLKRQDYSKRFFTQEDIDKLEKYKFEIDDQIRENNYEFYELAKNLYNKRMSNTKIYYEKYLAKPFDFTIDESLEYDSKKREYAKNEKELEDRWRKLLKYQVLTRLAEKLKEQEKAIEKNDTSVTIKELSLLDEEARERVKKNYDKWFKRLSRQTEKDQVSTFVNAIVNVFDPHTGYFPPKDKADFDIKLSGKLKGIGASLNEKDGTIQVVKIVPGSPCYRQGELEVDDKIVKVGQGDEEPIDVVDMPLDEAVQLIRGEIGTIVKLTVKKVDGSTKVIPIERDVVLLEETYAKSALIEKDDDKIGYIKLPKFYADFKDPKGRQCGRDVGCELDRLKEEEVEGIILDLRGNGGGSLQDVVDMVGHFIDEGPVVQIKRRSDENYVLRDKVSGLVYDGPLVVLVNSFSASASEILAAAIQDYGRGIIIGSNSTYGKGTVQRFYDLDQYLKGDYSEFRPMGAIKLTTQKFYRINGQTTQHMGVVPDIVLPDSYSYIDTGEKEQDHVIPWDEIEAVNFDKMKNKKFDKIIERSKKRIKGNETFGKINEDALRRKKNKDNTSYSLNLEDYRVFRKSIEDEAEQYKDIYKQERDLEVVMLDEDAMKFADDTLKQKDNGKWIERLEQDAYLEEAANVVLDMIN